MGTAAALRSAVFGACVLVASLAARADTLRVPSEEYPTIQSAVDAAGQRDTIRVEYGRYHERVVIAKDWIRIQGTDMPVIDAMGEGVALTLMECTGVTVAGFLLANADTGVEASGSNHALRNLWSASPPLRGFHLRECSDSTLLRCRVTGSGGNGFQIESSQGVTIDRCRVEEGLSGGIALVDVGRGQLQPRGALILGNTIQVSGDGITVHGATEVTLRGNRISAGGDYGILLWGTEAEVERNRIECASGVGVDSLAGGRVVYTGNRLQGCGMILGVGDGSVGAQVLIGNVARGGPFGFVLRNNLAKSNRVEDVDGVGVLVEGPGSTATGFFIRGTGDDGIRVLGAGNQLLGNRVLSSGGHGLRVLGEWNLVRRNVVRDSGGLDLADAFPEGVNTYEQNSFRTTGFEIP